MATMSNQARLTAKVPTAVQGEVTRLAKRFNIPVMILVGMLVDNSLADIRSGKLNISSPGIQPAVAKKKAAKKKAVAK